MPRARITRRRLAWGLSAAFAALVLLAPAAPSAPSSPAGQDRWDRAPTGTVVLGYSSRAAVSQALRLHPGRIVRTIPALGVAEVLPRSQPRHFATATSRVPGIDYAEPTAARGPTAEPSLLPASTTLPGGILQWQYAAVRAGAVPASVLRAAGAFTIATVDTGADLSAPDLADKSPVAHSVVTGSRDVRDTVGHGTFVAALAAGSVTNDDGIAGFGGDAKLLVVQASRAGGAFSDLDEAAAIVWAVDHGARIVNLSLGGPDTSSTERSAIDYAADRGALVVAAIGNEYAYGNPVEYPAALLQPVGSNGQGGRGLAVGASDQVGARAAFSNTGSHLSLLAPGVSVLSALSSTADNAGYVQVPLPGALGGLYGFGSGTSFAAPQVTGAAALVWAANPLLSPGEVAEILKQTASNRGAWNPETGYGVLDVAAAVERASGTRTAAATVTLKAENAAGPRIRLVWSGTAAASYALSVREGSGASRVVLPATRRTYTVFKGRFGQTYSFTVTAIDAAGAPAATSEPLTVTLPGVASLRLTASRTAGPAPLRVVLRASLAPAAGSAAVAGREVALEAVEDGRWQEAAVARTSASGRAAWTYTLDRGTYRLRARFARTDDLRGAVSRPVTIRVRN